MFSQNNNLSVACIYYNYPHYAKTRTTWIHPGYWRVYKYLKNTDMISRHSRNFLDPDIKQTDTITKCTKWEMYKMYTIKRLDYAAMEHFNCNRKQALPGLLHDLSSSSFVVAGYGWQSCLFYARQETLTSLENAKFWTILHNNKSFFESKLSKASYITWINKWWEEP